MKMITIKDMKAQTYMRPSFFPSIAEAVRGFQDIANNGDSMVSRYPNDFRLLHIGEFDSSTGAVIQIPETDLGSAADFKRRPEGQLPLETVN